MTCTEAKNDAMLSLAGKLTAKPPIPKEATMAVKSTSSRVNTITQVKTILKIFLKLYQSEMIFK